MNQLFGGILLAVGILVMTCSGLCSAFVIVMGAGAVVHEPSALMLPLVVGGLPFATGFGMYRWGRSLLNRTNDE